MGKTLGIRLDSVLKTSSGERAVADWLARHPKVLANSIGGAGRIEYVVSEFKFGSDFRADFVLLSPFSGGWDIYFFELEPPNERLFTKKGTPAKRLNEAIHQIDCWKTFVEKHRTTVLQELSKAAKTKNLLGNTDHREPADNCGWRLYHPRAFPNWQFKVAIGRRSDLNPVEMEKKASYISNHSIDVMTYDRLIEAAAELP